MLAAAEFTMPGRKGGRPKKDQEGGTKMVRVFADVADMASWVGRVEDVPVAQLLDPMIRASLVAKYEAYRPEIERIKKAEEAVERAEQHAREKSRKASGG